MALTSLDEAITKYQNRGWRIAEKHEDHVVMAKGERIPHGKHLLLTIVTLGIWGIFYGITLIFNPGLRRVRLQVNRRGRVVVTPLF